MARTARVVVPGLPHHVTQRGNRGGDVFFSGGDRQRYLVWLTDYASRYGLSVWAYCLMSNHVHLIAVPAQHASLAYTLRAVHTLHSQAVSAEHGWDGHLWHTRYFSAVLDDEHLWHAVRYVEQNPVRAGLVEHAEAWLWSSAPGHCGRRHDAFLARDLPLLHQIDDWAGWLRAPLEDGLLTQVREVTRRGVPWMAARPAALPPPSTRLLPR